MRNIKAIFTKQMLSYIKNPARWGAPAAFLGIPFIFLIFTPAGTDMALITAQFVIMFVGIAMVGTSAGFLIEDRDTMNLRFMSMAGVKPYQYLIATCSVLLVVSVVILYLFGMISGHSGEAMINFLILATLGAACSMLLGVTLGLTKIAPFTMIIGILLGVGPVLSADAGIEAMSRVFYFTFTYQVNSALREDLTSIPSDAMQIILINMAVILVAFVLTNLRTSLDGEKLLKATT